MLLSMSTAMYGTNLSTLIIIPYQIYSCEEYLKGNSKLPVRPEIQPNNRYNIRKKRQTKIKPLAAGSLM